MQKEISQEDIDSLFMYVVSYVRNGVSVTKALKLVGINRDAFYRKLIPEQIKGIKEARNNKGYVAYNLCLQMKCLIKRTTKHSLY